MTQSTRTLEIRKPRIRQADLLPRPDAFARSFIRRQREAEAARTANHLARDLRAVLARLNALYRRGA